jgi:hypothetical protein
VLYFTGERSPEPSQYAIPVLPAGYNYDLVNADVLLHRLRVEGGDYVRPEGGHYRLLVVPPDFLDAGRRVLLDLGRVEVLAEVFINGRSAGLVWKEPYRLDVTDAVHSGANALEIRVTDLWTNRLIGDEFLPPENQYGVADERGPRRPASPVCPTGACRANRSRPAAGRRSRPGGSATRTSRRSPPVCSAPCVCSIQCGWHYRSSNPAQRTYNSWQNTTTDLVERLDLKTL